MSRSARTRLTALLAVVALLVLGAVGAQAAQLKLTGQSTTITPSAATVKFLSDHGVSVAPIAPATAANGSITLPITGGRINSKSLRGFVIHRGGLKFTRKGKSATLRAFEINSRADGVHVSALASAGQRCSARRIVVISVRKHRRIVIRVRTVRRCVAVAKRIRVANLTHIKRTDGYNTATVTGDLELSAEGARLVNRALGTSVHKGAALGTATIVATYQP